MAVSISRRHAGLTRASTHRRHHTTMDCRVKPGNDACDYSAAFASRAAHALGEFRDQLGHRLDGARRRLALLVEAVLAPRRPAPSRPRRRRRLAAMARACSAVRTPKPTATGSLVWRLMRATAACDLAGIGRGRAGDAGDRDVVDEARGVREHRRQALVVGGRRREPDEVEPGLERRQAKLLVLLGRQVDDDQAVDAGRLGVGEKSVDAVDVDRIVVAHQHDRRRVVALAERAHHARASSSWSARP